MSGFAVAYDTLVLTQYKKACLLAALATLPIVGFAVHAEQPPEPRQSQLTEGDRQRLEAEAKQLWQNAQRLENEGKLKEAIADAEKAHAKRRQLVAEKESDIVSDFVWLGKARFRLSRYQDAIADFSKAAKVYEASGDRLSAAWMFDWLGACHRDLHDDEGAVKCYAEAVTRFETLNHKEGLSLNSGYLAEALFRLKRYRDAAAKFNEAAKAYEARAKPMNAAAMIGWRGDCFRELSENSSAVAAYEESLRRFAQLKDEEKRAARVEHAVILNNLAIMYSGMGKYVLAEPVFVQAADAIKIAVGEASPAYATTINNLASIHQKKGNYARAEALFQEVIRIRKKALGEGHRDYATALNNLGFLYYERGDYARAASFFRRALEIYKTAIGETNLDYARSVNNLATLYGTKGEYDRAESLCREASETFKKELGNEHPSYATTLSILAQLYQSMGEYQKAEPLFRKALEIKKEVLGEKHPDYAVDLNQLAALYFSVGDCMQAEPLYLQAMAIRRNALGEAHPDYGQSLSNLGELHRSLGSVVSAERFHLQAIEIRKQALGDSHPDVAASLNNLAGVYDSIGQYGKAEPLFRQALEIRKQTLGEQHPQYAVSLNNLAGLYTSIGDFAGAEPLYRQALEIRGKILGHAHPDYALSLNSLALLYVCKGDFAEALPLYHQALKVSRSSLDMAASIQSERRQLAMLSGVRYQLDALVALVADSPYIDSACYEEVLAWKGLVLRRQQAMRAVADRPELIPIWDELRATTTRLATLSLATPTPKEAADLHVKIADLSRHKEALESRLASASSEYRTSIKPIKVESLQDALSGNAVLLDFLEFSASRPRPAEQGGGRLWERRLAAFVVRHEGRVPLVDLGPIQPLAAAIETWRSSLGRTPESRDAAQHLRERLWLPLEKYLANAETVLISPDGEIGKLPFPALPGKAAGSYLIEEYSFAQVPAAQAIIGAPSVTGAKSGNLLIVANVDYDSRAKASAESAAKKEFEPRAVRDNADSPFPHLLGFLGELATIQKLYNDNFGLEGITKLESTSASKSAFAQEAPRHYYLHLATHGYFAAPQFRSALDRNLGHELQRHVSQAKEASSDAIPTTKRIAGIGTQLKFENGAFFVVRVFESGAAALDGRLREGDQILAVSRAQDDFAETAAMSLDDVLSLIRGEVGSRVRLRVKPANKDQVVVYELDRVDIPGLNETPSLNFASPQGISTYHPGLLSGLALAGANKPDENDDGILTAEEVTSLNLSGVRLVVLSACETGLGKVAGGEGLLGLQRAFQAAGARTVIASLWKVDDALTRDLMERFYDNLWKKNMGKLQALREAQLWMLRERGRRGLKEAEVDVAANAAASKRLAPEYWAAFVLSGDWR